MFKTVLRPPECLIQLISLLKLVALSIYMTGSRSIPKLVIKYAFISHSRSSLSTVVIQMLLGVGKHKWSRISEINLFNSVILNHENGLLTVPLLNTILYLQKRFYTCLDNQHIWSSQSYGRAKASLSLANTFVPISSSYKTMQKGDLQD